jgi:hypothetical protein
VQVQGKGKDSEDRIKKPVLRDDRAILVRDLHALSGKEVLDRILESENPQEIVQEMPSEDFFWIVKKVGEEDCLPLLELASVDQWQYVLDLEIWSKDRLDLAHTNHWMRQLQLADPQRLVRWLFGEGESLAYYHFSKTIEVVIKGEDEVLDLPNGFFSLDGLFYIKATDSEHMESTEKIIRVMASEDFDGYQALMLNLAGVPPAELEEELYRLKNTRLAEHGFLPLEEALSVYAPINPETLSVEKPPELPEILHDEEIRAMVPVFPLYNAGAKNMLAQATAGITDPLFIDKIRLEFAGLCNQILSADGLPIHELSVLIGICRKAAGYVNLALEKKCGRDISLAGQFLKSYPLVTLFRTGFGLVLRVKWEAERWFNGSWFHGQGLDPHFWGDSWGGLLTGLLAKRPKRYVGLQEEEEYRDFEWLSELGESLTVLRRLMVLDSLFERLTKRQPIDGRILHSSALSFRPLLFSLWARLLLRLEPSLSRISVEQTKRFFGLLRAGEKKPPYKMPGFEEAFIRDFMTYASDSDPEAASILEDTLSLIWRKFSEEYERVPVRDLDVRYSKFL